MSDLCGLVQSLTRIISILSLQQCFRCVFTAFFLVLALVCFFMCDYIIFCEWFFMDVSLFTLRLFEKKDRNYTQFFY